MGKIRKVYYCGWWGSNPRPKNPWSVDDAICQGISGVLVRLTTCKRLTNSLPKLSLYNIHNIHIRHWYVLSTCQETSANMPYKHSRPAGGLASENTNNNFSSLAPLYRIFLYPMMTIISSGQNKFGREPPRSDFFLTISRPKKIEIPSKRKKSILNFYDTLLPVRRPSDTLI